MTRIKLGLQDELYLGNMDAKRDWGHARDYIEMQWLMMQQEEPDDFVISTGEQYSVRDFVKKVAEELDMKIIFKGSGINEVGVFNNKEIIRVDPRYFRPCEVETLLGDSSKARQKLGWVPQTSFDELVKEMVEEDLKISKRDKLIKKHGFELLTRHE